MGSVAVDRKISHMACGCSWFYTWSIKETSFDRKSCVALTQPHVNGMKSVIRVEIAGR